MSTSRFPSTFLAFLFLRALGKSVSFVFSISLCHFQFSADLSPLCLAVKIVMIDNRSSASSPDSVSSTLMSELSTMIFVSCLTKIHLTSSKAKRQSRSYFYFFIFFYKFIYIMFMFLINFLLKNKYK